MEKHEEKIIADFKFNLLEDPVNADKNIAYAVFKTFAEVLAESNEATFRGLKELMSKTATYLEEKAITNVEYLRKRTVLTLRAACRIFLHMFEKEYAMHFEEISLLPEIVKLYVNSLLIF